MEKINRNQIKQTGIEQLDSIDQYDMYILNFYLLNGETKQVRVFTEKNTFPQIGSNKWKKLRENQLGDIYEFFIGRLFGEDGLFKKEKRTDYIYLGGNFRKNDMLASRYIIQANGKRGQDNFDLKLFDLKLKIEANEKKPSGVKTQTNNLGKHYAISDIHGMYGSYEAVIKSLKTQDELYIIGDVIDRGKDGIKILQDIIKRKNKSEVNPKINFLLGNHEAQFLSVLKMIRMYNLTDDDIVVMYLWNIYKAQKGNAILDADNQKIQEFTKKLNDCDIEYRKIIDEKGVNDKQRDYLYMWMFKNKGLQTFINYSELTDKEKDEIYEFLYNSNMIMAEEIQNKNYLFVHATPTMDRKILRGLNSNKRSYKIFELELSDRICMLETRNADKSYILAKEMGFTTICGHDPSLGEIIKNDDYNYVRIDAGCGQSGKLAMYCIEDDKVKYIDEMCVLNEVEYQD